MERKGFLYTFFAAFALMFCLSFVSPIKAEAATSFKKLDFSYDSSTGKYKTVKVGNYTFKYTLSSDRTSKISVKKGSSGYKSTLLTGSIITNGKIAYYTSNCKLYSYTLSSGKSKSLKKLPSGSDNYFSIDKVYNDRIYMTCSSFNNWNMKVYSYNIKTKKLAKVKNNCSIDSDIGKYCLCDTEFRSDYQPCSYYLYKITSTGKLKKVKLMSKNCLETWTVGNKFYLACYNSYKSSGLSKVTLYRYNKDGSGKKKLATISSKGGYMVTITEVKSTYCKYYDSATGKTKKYTYK